MADKEKRLRKLLSRKGFKGQFKSVATLEEARLVLIKKIGLADFRLIRKKDYLEFIERGYTFPVEEVYYLVFTNPRDAQSIERKYFTNAPANMKSKPK